jgi:hypothetical protein
MVAIQTLGVQPQQLPCLCYGSGLAPVSAGHFDDALNERRVRWRKSVAVKAHIVFKTRATVSAKLKRPEIERDLVDLAPVRSRPGRARNVVM